MHAPQAVTSIKTVLLQRRSGLRSVAVLFSLWTLPGLLYSVQHYQAGRWWGEITLWQALLPGLPSWWIFVPVSYLVAAAARRHPIGWHGGLKPILFHFVLCVFVVSVLVVLVGLWFSITRNYWAEGDYTWAQWIRALFGSTHVHLFAFSYLLIVLVTHSLEYERRSQIRELGAAHREMELARAQIESLNRQLQPHFLLNALNAVSTQILRGDEQGARQMLASLGRFLNAALELEDRQAVPLSEELELLQSYLDVERARWCERLRVRIDVTPAAREALVPPLLLQPLVENAIRHGIAALEAGGEVVIQAEKQNEQLLLAVENDGIGLSETWSERAAEAIGLTNTRRRLDHLFADHDLSLSSRPGGRVQVRLLIPFATKPILAGAGP